MVPGAESNHRHCDFQSRNRDRRRTAANGFDVDKSSSYIDIPFAVVRWAFATNRHVLCPPCAPEIGART